MFNLRLDSHYHLDGAVVLQNCSRVLLLSRAFLIQVTAQGASLELVFMLRAYSSVLLRMSVWISLLP